MGLLAVIMLGLAATAGISARGGVMSKKRISATYLATRMLETLCAGNIADITPFNDDDTSDSATYPAGGVTDAWGQEIRDRLDPNANGTITVQANQPSTGKFRVTVTVWWTVQNRTSSLQIVGMR